MPEDMTASTTPSLRLRTPDPSDGADIWSLIKSCKPLDENSMYANLIQADHFRDTCVVAEFEGAILGWISGHIIPNTKELFVWQVAVSPNARGLGLGKKMLLELINRDSARDAVALKTTITRDNDASWALFKSFAFAVGGDLQHASHFDRDAHFAGQHETEHMVTITLPERGTLQHAA
ncbi:diaminobutyrate acetyltransferase [Marivita sp. S0852]|uniref:diaminobutyrate acetyltransferase n=1 Tax=Marivita sp. S0852 TaxID=3373893 RepID=UPI003981C13B